MNIETRWICGNFEKFLTYYILSQKIAIYLDTNKYNRYRSSYYKNQLQHNYFILLMVTHKLAQYTLISPHPPTQPQLQAINQSAQRFDADMKLLSHRYLLNSQLQNCLISSGFPSKTQEIVFVNKYSRKYLLIIRKNKIQNYLLTIDELKLDRANALRLILEALGLVESLHRLGLKLRDKLQSYLVREAKPNGEQRVSLVKITFVSYQKSAKKINQERQNKLMKINEQQQKMLFQFIKKLYYKGYPSSQSTFHIAHLNKILKQYAQRQIVLDLKQLEFWLTNYYHENDKYRFKMSFERQTEEVLVSIYKKPETNNVPFHYKCKQKMRLAGSQREITAIDMFCRLSYCLKKQSRFRVENYNCIAFWHTSTKKQEQIEFQQMQDQQFSHDCLFQVVSTYKTQNKEGEYFTSGYGTLVAPRLILTCAHNIIDKSNKIQKFAVQTYIQLANKKKIKIQDYRYLKQYVQNTSDPQICRKNDLALLLLSEPIHSKEYIRLAMINENKPESIQIPITRNKKIIIQKSYDVKYCDKIGRFKYMINTKKGDSGCPLIYCVNKNLEIFYLVGFHTLGTNTYNQGITLNQHLVQKICQFQQQLITNQNQRRILLNSRDLDQNCDHFFEDKYLSYVIRHNLANLREIVDTMHEQTCQEKVQNEEQCQGQVNDHPFNKLFGSLMNHLVLSQKTNEADKLGSLSKYLKQKIEYNLQNSQNSCNLLFFIIRLCEIVQKLVQNRDRYANNPAYQQRHRYNLDMNFKRQQIRLIFSLADQLKIQDFCVNLLIFKQQSPQSIETWFKLFKQLFKFYLKLMVDPVNDKPFFTLQQYMAEAPEFISNYNMLFLLARSHSFNTNDLRYLDKFSQFNLSKSFMKFQNITEKSNKYNQQHIQEMQYTFGQLAPYYKIIAKTDFKMTNKIQLHLVIEDPQQMVSKYGNLRQLPNIANMIQIQHFRKNSLEWQKRKAALAEMKNYQDRYFSLNLWKLSDPALLKSNQKISGNPHYHNMLQQYSYYFTAFKSFQLFYTDTFQTIQTPSIYQFLSNTTALSKLVLKILRQIQMLHVRNVGLYCPIQFCMLVYPKQPQEFDITFFYIGHPFWLPNVIYKNYDNYDALDMLGQYYPLQEIIGIGNSAVAGDSLEIDVWMLGKSLMRLFEKCSSQQSFSFISEVKIVLEKQALCGKDKRLSIGRLVQKIASICQK